MKITVDKKTNKFTRHTGNKAIVYVDSNLLDKLDVDLYYPYVLDLKVQSSAWNTVKNKATKLIGNEISKFLDEKYKVRYSKSAGCKCGCSPGYIIERDNNVPFDKLSPALNFGEMWLDISSSEEELQDFENEYYEKFKLEVMKEALMTPVETH